MIVLPPVYRIVQAPLARRTEALVNASSTFQPRPSIGQRANVPFRSFQRTDGKPTDAGKKLGIVAVIQLVAGACLASMRKD